MKPMDAVLFWGGAFAIMITIMLFVVIRGPAADIRSITIHEITPDGHDR